DRGMQGSIAEVDRFAKGGNRSRGIGRSGIPRSDDMDIMPQHIQSASELLGKCSHSPFHGWKLTGNEAYTHGLIPCRTQAGTEHVQIGTHALSAQCRVIAQESLDAFDQ